MTNTKPRPADDEQYWSLLATARVSFSDCGSFCFLTYPYGEMIILESSLLTENAARMQAPTVWRGKIYYNQRFFQVGLPENATMVNIYQSINYIDSSGLRGLARIDARSEFANPVAITAVPAHLASAAVCLLVGKSRDDLTRMLFLPEKGPPEIKDLRVTLNQILDELATRSAKPQSACLKFIGSTTEEDTSDISSEGVPVSADEDGLGINEEESNYKVSQETAISANDDRPEVSDTN